jgi:hypothetical protein
MWPVIAANRRPAPRAGAWVIHSCGLVRVNESSMRLGCEKTLAQEYGVAVNTVRKAMAALRKKG